MTRVLNRLVCHAMRAFYPTTDELPGIADTDVEAFIARYRKETAPLMWAGVCAGSAVFALTPLLTVARPLPSFLLSRERLDQHAHKISSSPFYLVRQSIFLVKLAAGMCWASHPDVRGKMGMDAYPSDPDDWRTS